MLVQRGQLHEVLRRLEQKSKFAVDTETTGLNCYGGDRLFSIIISTDEETYYFNYHEKPDIPAEYVLKRGGFASIFGRKDTVVFMHNAKFDLGMLAKEGITFAGTVHCTYACGRLLDCDLPSYSLSALAPMVGFAKSTAVEDNIKKLKLYTEVHYPGKKKVTKVPHYDRVAFDIIVPYGEQDGRATYALGEYQREKLLGRTIYHTECELTKALFRMERGGIKIDRSYCEAALAAEHRRIEAAKARFMEISGTPFEDTKAVFIEAFTKAGEVIPKTPKGNHCFNKEALASFTTPLADVIREYRDAYKRAGSYFQNFLTYADASDMVHANLNQAGCKTGRMSVTNPALQTVNKEDSVDVVRDNVVRRSFIPEDGFTLFMLDYDQMEYRAMLDSAGEQKVIDRVNSGLDVHEATADVMHVDRKTAKTINFRLLYGGGARGLAEALKIPELEGFDLRRRYFNVLPNVARWITDIRTKISVTGKLTNKFGRRYEISRRKAYVGPNHYIQGSTADAIKWAVVELDDFLRHKKSRMLLVVHDEIIFSVHDSEHHLIPGIKDIMERAWISDKITLTVGVKHSSKSWADGEEYRVQD